MQVRLPELTGGLLAVVLLGAGMFGACWRTETPPVWMPADAGPPATVPADAGLPIVRDNSEDFDAGYNPFVGKWKYLPGEPVNCKIRIAEEPAASVTALTFEPCKSRPGCTRLVVDWWTNPYYALRFPDVEPVRLVRGKPYINLWKQYSTGQFLYNPIAWISVVLPIDGAPVFAAGVFTHGQFCPFATTHDPDGIGMHAWPRPYRTWDFFGWSTWEAPTSVDSVTFPHNQIPCDVCQEAVASGGSFACGCDGPPYAILFDKAQRRAILPGAPGPMFLGGPLFPPVRDGFVTEGFDRPYSFDLLRRDGTHTKLIWPSANNTFSFGVDRSAGEAFAWVEIAGEAFGPFTDGVLWTSPYASQQADLAPRKVAKLPVITYRGARYMAVNAGMALQTISSTTALLTRLSDGWSWSITAEPEDVWSRALWVDDKEVWLSVEAAQSNQAVWSIVRIGRDSLGPPTVDPGL